MELKKFITVTQWEISVAKPLNIYLNHVLIYLMD